MHMFHTVESTTATKVPLQSRTEEEEERSWDCNPGMNECLLTLAEAIGSTDSFWRWTLMTAVTSCDRRDFDCPIFPQGLEAPTYPHLWMTSLPGDPHYKLGGSLKQSWSINCIQILLKGEYASTIQARWQLCIVRVDLKIHTHQECMFCTIWKPYPCILVVSKNYISHLSSAGEETYTPTKM